MARAKEGAGSEVNRLSRVRDWLPLIMSVLAFTVSLTSLYYAALRGGSVTALSGPLVLLSHDPLTGAANVSVAVNLSNTGARLTTVRQVQLSITSPDGMTVLLPAVAQQKLNSQGEPQDDALVAPITLAPRSETTRQLRFTPAPADSERVAFIKPGAYRFQLSLQLGETAQAAEQWQVQLGENEARQLEHWWRLNIGNTLAIMKSAAASEMP